MPPASTVSMPDRRRLARRVRELRELHHLRDYELAVRAGVAPLTVMRLERAQGSPFLATVASIERALEVRPGELERLIAEGEASESLDGEAVFAKFRKLPSRRQRNPAK